MTALTAAAYPRRTWTPVDALLAFLVTWATGAGVAYFTKYVAGAGDDWPIVWPWSFWRYTLGSVLVVGLLWAFVMRPGAKLPARWLVSAAAWAGMAVLLVFYIHFEPKYAPGSDNASALYNGAKALVTGHFPYHFRSHLGGPISPMLGGILMAIPFLTLHSMWSQTIVWLVAPLRALQRVAGSAPAFAAITLTAWSVMMREALPRQSDNWICAVAVVWFGSWGYLLARREADGHGHRGPWWVPTALKYAWVVAFACALAYRFTLWAAVVPLAVLWWRSLGWDSLRRWYLPAGIATLILVLGPALVDAKAYAEGPLAMGVAKTGGRGAGIIIAVGTLVALVVSSWFVRSLAGVWSSLAITMGTMILLTGAVRIPAQGFVGAYTNYFTVAYNGAIFMPALAALLLPTTIGRVERLTRGR